MTAFATRRIARIYPLYLACAALVLITIGSRGASLGATAAHLTLLQNVVPGRQHAFIAVSWTLTIEVLFYLTMPILAAALARRWCRGIPAALLARGILGSAILSIAWMLVGGALASGSPTLSLYVRQLFPSMWSMFCGGLLIAVAMTAPARERDRSAILRFVDRLRHDGPFAWSVALAGAGLGVLSFFGRPEWSITAQVWALDLGRIGWAVASTALVVRAIDAHRIAERSPRALQALGTWSYGIYLIHGAGVTILLAQDDLIPLRHGGTVAFFTHLTFVLSWTLPLSWLSWRFLEAPAIRAGRRWTAQRQRSQARLDPDSEVPAV